MFVAAVAFACGVLAADVLWRPPHAWLAASLAAALGAVLLYRTSPATALGLALFALVPLGGFYLQLYDSAQLALPDLQAFSTGQGEVAVTAHVIREGVVREGNYGGKQESVDVEAERLQVGERVLTAPIGIRLTIYSKQSEEETANGSGTPSPLPVYTYGERLRFPARLRMPRNYGNPGAVDTVGYLSRQGIRLTGSAPASAVMVLPGFVGTRVGDVRSAARRSVLAHITTLWPGERGALMQAMLIGGRAFFGRDLKTNFQRTGTYHILVVSGINVGILAFAVFWVLRKMPLGETWATILTILLSCGYAFLADLGPPIVRATLTLNLYLLTRLLFRDRAGLNALGVAALGMLVVNPRTLFEASFQLTFLSVIAVAGLAVPLLRRSIYPLQTALRNLDSPAYDYSLPTRAAQFRSDLRLIREQLKGIVGRRISKFVIVRTTSFVLAAAELLLISTIIQLALALPMAWYFHRATTMSLPANVLVIPIAGVLMPTAVLAVSVSYLSLLLAYVPAQVTSHALDVLTGTIRLIGHLRMSDVRTPSPSLVVAWVAAAAFALALVLVRRRPWIAAAGIAALSVSALCIIALPPPPQWHPGVFEITVIDVGQGDSLLLITPEGKTLLLDAGGVPGNSQSDFDVGEEVVSPYLWSRGIRGLDAIAVSHAHTDHMGGMRSVIANFHPHEFWYGVESPSPGFQDLLRTARAFDTKLKPWTAGDTFKFGGVEIRVLNPKSGSPVDDRDVDDQSLVLRAQFGATSALLVGDAHQKIEQLLLQEAPQADLLKVGHHGSATSSSQEFLAAVKPRYAVVSVGFYNSFNHPRPEVMQRFSDAGIHTYRTDLSGATTFYLDGHSVSARPVPR